MTQGIKEGLIFGSVMFAVTMNGVVTDGSVRAYTTWITVSIMSGIVATLVVRWRRRVDRFPGWYRTDGGEIVAFYGVRHAGDLVCVRESDNHVITVPPDRVRYERNFRVTSARDLRASR